MRYDRSDLSRFLAYANKDLLKLGPDETREVIGRANRVRPPKYWPAFIARMRDTKGQKLIVYLESNMSQHFYQNAPSETWFRISVLNASGPLWPPQEMSFGTRVLVGGFDVVQNPLGDQYGDLMAVEVVAARGFDVFPVSKQFYAVDQGRFCLLRQEDREGSPLPVAYLPGRDFNPCYPYPDNVFTSLQSKSHVAKLQALIFLTARHCEWTDPRTEQEHGITLKQVASSALIRKLAQHENTWLRDYASLFLRLQDARANKEKAAERGSSPSPPKD